MQQETTHSYELAATGEPVAIEAGTYMFMVRGAPGGSVISLQIQSPDGWADVQCCGAPVSTSSLPFCQVDIELPAGNVRLARTGDGSPSGLTASLITLDKNLCPTGMKDVPKFIDQYAFACGEAVAIKEGYDFSLGVAGNLEGAPVSFQTQAADGSWSDLQIAGGVVKSSSAPFFCSIPYLPACNARLFCDGGAPGGIAGSLGGHRYGLG